MTSPLTRTDQMREAERREDAKNKLIIAMTRYPIVSQTLMRTSIQIGNYLDATVSRCLEEPDEEAGGRPYLSIVPFYRGLTRAPRYYLSRYESLLQPLFQPRLVETLHGARAKERQRIIEALDRFPILNPTLMQAALGPTAAKYFKDDLAFLIETGVITIWHEDLLTPEFVDSTLRTIHADVTHRGVRYFLTEHTDLLQPFLIPASTEKKRIR